VGLERGPLSLVSTTEELLGRKSSGFGLENREYGSRDPSRSRGTLYPHKLVLTSPTSGGRSVGIVRYRTQATEIFSPCRETPQAGNVELRITGSVGNSVAKFAGNEVAGKAISDSWEEKRDDSNKQKKVTISL
jgi:hypothetical protein